MRSLAHACIALTLCAAAVLCGQAGGKEPPYDQRPLGRRGRGPDWVARLDWEPAENREDWAKGWLITVLQSNRGGSIVNPFQERGFDRSCFLVFYDGDGLIDVVGDFEQETTRIGAAQPLPSLSLHPGRGAGTIHHLPEKIVTRVADEARQPVFAQAVYTTAVYKVGRRDKPADGRQLDSWLRSASDHIMAVSAPQELRRSGAKKPTYARRDDVLPSDDPLWVSLETEKEHFTLGERVQLRVRFVNAGAEQLYVPQSPIYYHSNLTPSDLRMESAAGQDLGAVGQPIVSMPPNGSLVRIARHGVYERVYTFPAGQRPGGGFPTNRPLLGEYHLTLRTFFSFPKDKNTLPNFTERYPFSVEELPENQELISKRMLVLPKIPIKIGTAAAGAED